MRSGWRIAVAVVALAVVSGACSTDRSEDGGRATPVDVASYGWELTADGAPWGGRAGLRVLELEESLYVLGGRTPRPSTIPGDSDIWADVWRSQDRGLTWQPVWTGDDGGWPARAYFQAVVKDDTMFVLGGQDFGLEPNPFCAMLEQGLKPPPGLGIDPDAPCPEFLPTSRFFNDVWASTDGATWEQRTGAAPWAGRAGLSAATFGDHLYVFGGSTNDDSSIIGANGPQREYFNDVWRSTDGTDWELATAEAPWEPRAGASVVTYDGAIWLFGGEAGFLCDPTPGCEPPYFNDVWRTTDGETWTEINPSAPWSPRPGHQCEVLGAGFACFGGFGIERNPTDLWFSPDGVTWTEHRDPAWNAADPDAIRYDFDSLVIETDSGPAVLTVGGDRETFDFDDPENHLRIEDDVWRFALPESDS